MNQASYQIAPSRIIRAVVPVYRPLSRRKC
nr:MAG TPA: hypothetical protein [Caudoviricetes sp.]